MNVIALCRLVALPLLCAASACGSQSAAEPPADLPLGGAPGAGTSGGGSAGQVASAGASGALAAAGASGALAAAGSAGSSAGSAGVAGASGSVGASGATSAGSGGSAGSSSGGAASMAGSGGFQPWPGGNSVITVDPKGTYESDLSGLMYEPAQGASPAVLWAVQNSPSKLYRLLWNGTTWSSDTSNGWSSGKTLRFPDGSGAPDSEGVTKGVFGTNGVYASIERDNDDGNVSRLSVLLFDSSATGSTLDATREWNLTAALPKLGSNLGLEAIAWIPDSYLVDRGFIDESKNALYEPANYANHAGGLFFVGAEGNGMIYAFALDHSAGSFRKIATIDSGQASVMDLSFDRDVGYLWAACDDTCNGRINVLSVDTRLGAAMKGKFAVQRGFERPGTMPNLNNEGFTVTTESTCQAGFKTVFYAEDGSSNGYAIRRDSIPCGAFL